MYRPRAYREDDRDRVLALMRGNPFAVLISHGTGGLGATHLPLLVLDGQDGSIELLGHLSRANDQWRHLRAGDEVLAVFSGVHGYVSPDWYPVEPDVPTWNYQAVHAYGVWHLLDTDEDLKSLLSETVNHFEAPRERPWHLGRLPQDLIDSLKRGVIGFRITVSRLEAAGKLSQDKCPADVEGVVAGLNLEGDPQLAKAVADANPAER